MKVFTQSLTGTLHLEQIQQRGSKCAWVLWCWWYQHIKNQWALSLSVRLVILHSYSAACYVTPERICPNLCCFIYMRKYLSSKPSLCMLFMLTTAPYSCMPTSTHMCLPRDRSLSPRLNAIPETTSCIQTSSLRPRPSDWRLVHPWLWSCRYTHIKKLLTASKLGSLKSVRLVQFAAVSLQYVTGIHPQNCLDISNYMGIKLFVCLECHWDEVWYLLILLCIF